MDADSQGDSECAKVIANLLAGPQQSQETSLTPNDELAKHTRRLKCVPIQMTLAKLNGPFTFNGDAHTHTLFPLNARCFVRWFAGPLARSLPMSQVLSLLAHAATQT